jgi:hypothetical protein
VSSGNSGFGELHNTLFEQLNRLNDTSKKGDELKDEIERSKAMVNVAGSIIDNGNLIIKATVATHEYMIDSSSLPEMFHLQQPIKRGLTDSPSKADADRLLLSSRVKELISLHLRQENIDKDTFSHLVAKRADISQPAVYNMLFNHHLTIRGVAAILSVILDVGIYISSENGNGVWEVKI